MAAGYRMAAILIFVVFKLAAACEVDDVAVYKVKLQMLWSEERFPKDYPQNRPKAQWSQVFETKSTFLQYGSALVASLTLQNAIGDGYHSSLGQSHNSSYTLYKVHEVSRPSLREFAQFGKLDKLVNEGDDEPRVYDQFSAPAIEKGVGETENMVFVDGSHSMISFVCRLIPSPDWFIGVDSLNLCVDTSWVDQVTLDLEPLDAGAASGLTFTAPRWENVPPDPVTKHKPRSPNHPAAGFYYPDLKELPAIAKVEITKVKQYSTKELNDLIRKDLIKQLKDKDRRKGLPKKQNMQQAKEIITTKSYDDQLKDLEEDPVGTPRSNLPENYVEVVTQSATSTTTESEFEGDLKNMDDVVLAVAHGRKLGLHKHLPRHFRSRLHHAVNKIQPNDCLVSEWTEWTPCSKTCGFGDKFRSRSILRHKKKGGRDCPLLTEKKHCGNVNSCTHIDYFEW